jgi:hypothetical protein
MSLQTLVQYAQEHFAARAPSFLDGQDSRSIGVSSPRPGVPSWLVNPAAHQELVYDSSQPWIIEGPVDPGPTIDDYYGADTLAFYLPFHFYRERWGIYLSSSGTLWLAAVLKGASLLPGDETYLHVAEWFLLEHELFHAYTEIASTRAELILGSPLYGAYFEDRIGGEHEEAMANAHALLSTDTSLIPNARQTLEEWMGRQGAGYRDYHLWSRWPALIRGRNRAVSFMLTSQPRRPPRTGSPQEFLYRGTSLYRLPITRVHDSSNANIGIVRPFPKEFGLQVHVHSNEHPPPHIHIHVVQDGQKTRYRWPELVPLENDDALSRKASSALEDYVARHGNEINARVETVYRREI